VCAGRGTCGVCRGGADTPSSLDVHWTGKVAPSSVRRPSASFTARCPVRARRGNPTTPLANRRAGATPLCPMRPVYRWLYSHAFARPHTWKTYWLLLTVSGTAFTTTLGAFAAATGMGDRKRIVSMLNSAGWRSSAVVTIPAGIHPAPLSPYSPELQPIERVGVLSDEPRRTGRREHRGSGGCTGGVLPDVAGAAKTIWAHTRFHWWPRFNHPVSISDWPRLSRCRASGC
jgi:hypothetical protein